MLSAPSTKHRSNCTVLALGCSTVAKDGEGEVPMPGVASPKPPPALTNGEYGLLVDGENDETKSNITLSSVAFMRKIIFARRLAGNGLSAP